MPKPGDGTKIFANRDGSLTCSWDNPRMAMDADINVPDEDGGDDLADKIHQLLDGKLDDADIEQLLELIQGAAPQAQPAPIAGDRRRGMATDELQRRVASGLARQTRTATASLVARFPALKNARVV